MTTIHGNVGSSPSTRQHSTAVSSTPWHTKSVKEICSILGANPEGLSEEEATRRLGQYGPNELVEKKGHSPLAILASQFTNVMVVVLIVAAVISGITGDLKDTAVIGVILVLNAVLGFVQEYKAEKAMTALKALATPIVRVTRDGKTREISSRELVPGDILHLETGGHVGADARLIDVFNLRIEEAALTGESVPVEKTVQSNEDEHAPIGDRESMVFAGTVVTYGRGSAIVVTTGMQTELGQIAEMLQSSEEKQTPLQGRLAFLGKLLAGIALAVCALVFLIGFLRGEAPKEMFLTAISLAVAAIPESLPAIITVALALGAQRMVRQNALIRKLPAVETLGCVTTICSDKTGTLTQNKMTATGLYLPNKHIEVTGSGYKPAGELLFEGLQVGKDDPSIDLPLRGFLLCNDSYLAPPPEESEEDWRVVGDPTEGALVVLAAKAGMDKDALATEMPRLAEIPFDSDRKRMTTFHRYSAGVVSFTKGALDSTIDRCNHILIDGQRKELTKELREEIERTNNAIASEGQRVLTLAYREWVEIPSELTVENVENDLVYVALVSMIDPPREEASQAVATCQSAGVKPVLITGDHKLTAEAIARRIGILRDGDRSISGTDLDAMDDESLIHQVDHISVYSRVSPLHKMRVVKALQRRGHIVAMTGDGVNDAPALKQADIGIAMGITGTDVSKEAADMILTNDNFATIVKAVSEGRTIYDNIRKFIRYMITTNTAEVLTVAVAMFVGLPMPLLAIQILWINLVTDGLPAVALGFEPAERSVMKRPPRDPQESLFARGMWQHIAWAGTLMATCSLGVFIWGLDNGTLAEARTMVFFTLAGSQMAHALAIRSELESLFSIGLRSNLYLTGAVISTLLLQVGVLYVPFLQGVFQTVALGPTQLALCLGLSSTIFFAVEIEKAFYRRAETKRQTSAMTKA